MVNRTRLLVGLAGLLAACGGVPSERNAAVYETLGADASAGSTCYHGLSTQLPNETTVPGQWWTCIPSQGSMVAPV
jgi:hypothetical protein